jgi:hypothetical protein
MVKTETYTYTQLIDPLLFWWKKNRKQNKVKENEMRGLLW